MVSPVNASRQPSRAAAHHSGPERLARPYSAVDFHLLSFVSLSWRTLLLAMNRPPVARNRLPLYPRKPTFSWPSLTSGCDPNRTFVARLANPRSAAQWDDRHARAQDGPRHWTRLIPLAPPGPNITVSGLEPMLAFPVKNTLPATMLVAPPGSLFPANLTRLFGA